MQVDTSRTGLRHSANATFTPQCGAAPGLFGLMGAPFQFARNAEIYGEGDEAEYLYQVSDALHVEEGSLYPALHRLESQGLVESTWGVSENNRRARFYKLTPRGRKQVAVKVSDWRRMVEAVNRVIDPLVS